MYRSIIYSLFLLLSFGASAQQSYTLQQCIDTALANYIPVKQSALNSEVADVNLKQSRMRLLPNLNANVNHGVNSGRSIDPFTNTYVNQSVNTANYGLGSEIVLFNGLLRQNTIRQYAFTYDATRMELQQVKDKLILDVISNYLGVLNAEDKLNVTLKTPEVTKSSIDRLEILNRQGGIRPSDLSDLRGQYMEEQLDVLDAKTQLETAKLALLQLMNKPYDATLKLERINVEEFMSKYPMTSTEVFANALNQFAYIKAVELRKKGFQYGVKSAKGNFYPQLTLGADFNTTYSSVAQNAGVKIPYSNQLKNNRFSTIGLGLRIPIFNGLAARYDVKRAEILLKNSELVEESTSQLLHQQIDLAYLEMTRVYERYKLLLEQVNALQESFNAAQVRFNAGVGTSIDFLTAKVRYDRAVINLLTAKYDFVLSKRILDYYNGKP